VSAPGEIPDGLRPTLGLLVKLGSIARHVEEATGPTPSPLDLQTAATLAGDPEVTAWLNAADRYALLPVPRG
jgi:hypothetical protein